MVTNVLYEVRVDATLAKNSTLLLGVTIISPDCFKVTKYYKYPEDSVIIASNATFKHGKWVLRWLGEGLKRLEVGSRVGLLVDSSNDLHLYVDGQDQGVAATRVTQPCFALFEIWHTVIKVTALPTSRRT